MKRVGATSWILAVATLALIWLPLAAIAVASFNAARFGAEWKGFTLGWYASLFGHGAAVTDRALLVPAIRAATANSLILAAASTAIATALGTALALALEAAPWPRRLRAAIETTMRLPLVVPDLLLAAALVVAIKVLAAFWDAAAPGMAAMIAGHVTFQVPLVALVVHARLRQIGVAQIETARDLYASRWFAASRVVLPQLTSAIVAAAMLAAIVSLDDFVVSFFTASPRTQVLPMLIYAQAKRGVPAEIDALATLIVAATSVAAVAIVLITRPRRST
ncbi:MAG TPA: ABC transporter permease subunit [Planctomycetota bacterium]|nr:ABC transporter permease subunit [Planctomycetota bacterium]